MPLFVRHAWGMEPTGYGDAFTRYARSLLSEVEEASLELRALAAGARGVLRVGAVTGAVPRWLAPAIIAVRRDRPALRVFILVNTSDVLADALIAGTLDVAIGRLPATADARLLEAQPLAEEPLCVVARSGHPLVRRRTVRPGDLAQASWILQPPGSPTRQETDAMFDRMGLRMGVEAIETASIRRDAGAAALERCAERRAGGPRGAFRRPGVARAGPDRRAGRREPLRADRPARPGARGAGASLRGGDPGDRRAAAAPHAGPSCRGGLTAYPAAGRRRSGG